jgi:alkylhydroperoxidase family enzyme
MAWLGTIPRREATGVLAETYATLAARPIPDAYRPPHDDAPGIIRAHSLDPELMRRTFAMSGSLHRSTLDWADRELISSVTSRTNECFY